MTTGEAIKGMAMVCSQGGRIEEVLRDDFGVLEMSRGKIFFNIIDPGNRQKAMDFILETQKNNIAFDYQLNVLLGEEPRTLYFLGIHLDNKILLIGADNHKEAIEFTNHLQEVSNEQANQIRSLLKEKLSQNQGNTNETEQLFDELSRLNNELVNLQRELSKKNAELERINEQKNQLLGMAAHDLRNPLGIIQGYADFLILELSDKLSKEHISILKTMFESTEFMLSLIEELLDYSKIESGKVSLSLADVDLRELIENNLTLNRTLAAKKHIRIQFASSLKRVIVKVDKHKIEQVLNNLISNAIKFSHSDSEINVQLENVKIYVVLRVKDQGIGMNRDEMEKLFVPFAKIAEKGTMGEQGTGLGLSIVKKIIESHNGNIEVKSEKGRGSEFIIRLPLIEKDE